MNNHMTRKIFPADLLLSWLVPFNVGQIDPIRVVGEHKQFT
jgi:hypothetical protein